METEKSKIGELYRNAFQKFNAEPSHELWEKISKHPGLKPAQKPGFLTMKKVILSSVAIIATVSILYVFKPELKENLKRESQISNQIKDINQSVKNQSIPSTITGVANSAKITAKHVSIKGESVNTNENEAAKPSLVELISEKVPISKLSEPESKTQKLSTLAQVTLKQEQRLISNNPSTKLKTTDNSENNNTFSENTVKSTIDFSDDQMICKGDSVRLSASGGESYIWSNGSTSAYIMVSPSNTSAYTVSVTDFNGALIIHDFTVKVGDCSVISIPNAFTPNSDNLNDIFKAAGQDITGFSMIIFSRTSQVLFESHEISKGWDGYIKGKIAETGVYIYQIKYTDTLGKSHTVNGHLTLLR